jgi:hypothetical protein
MRISTKFALLMASLLFGLVLVPQAARAQTSSNCPTEPATNVPIALGEVFEGTNCILYTDGDIDSFVFTGTSGDTYEFGAALNGASENICLTVLNPSLKQVAYDCTNWYDIALYSVVTTLKLAATGTYTMEVTEESSGKQYYAVSLQKLLPFPSYATAVPKLDDSLPGNIAQLTDTNFFTFPVATTGLYRVTGTLPASPSQNVCGTLYFPNLTSAGTQCTNWYDQGIYNFEIQFQPTTAEAGTAMVAVQEAGNDGTQTYSFEVSCVAGNCPPPVPPPPPPCTLSDTLSYDASNSTLTMKFTVGNNEGATATWSGWLTYEPDTIKSVFSPESLATADKPPVEITKTYTDLPKEGTVGVLSTLTTPQNGTVCSSWVQIYTGTGP